MGEVLFESLPQLGTQWLAIAFKMKPGTCCKADFLAQVVLYYGGFVLTLVFTVPVVTLVCLMLRIFLHNYHCQCLLLIMIGEWRHLFLLDVNLKVDCRKLAID